MGEKFSHLTLDARLKMEGMLLAKAKPKEIAKHLNVHRSTVYREMKRGEYMHRNSDYTEEKRYAPETAYQLYREHLKEKGRELKIGKDIEYANYIENKIVKDKYSPAAALMSAEKSGNFKTQICVSTLYSYIDKEIFLNLTNKNLPVKRNSGKRKYEKVKIQKRKSAGTSIEKRPKDIENREEFGNWEMDTVVGKQGTGKKAFLVLTERKTREEIIYILRHHTSKEVVTALNRLEKEIGTENFRKIFKTITVDNGTEFADEKGMSTARRSKQPRTDIYYCHPYSSSERGSNENNNKLIRRHVPKGIVFDDMTQNEVRAMQDWINNYPRRLLNKHSAAELFELELNKLNIPDKQLPIIKEILLPRSRASPAI